MKKYILLLIIATAFTLSSEAYVKSISVYGTPEGNFASIKQSVGGWTNTIHCVVGGRTRSSGGGGSVYAYAKATRKTGQSLYGVYVSFSGVDSQCIRDTFTNSSIYEVSVYAMVTNGESVSTVSW